MPALQQNVENILTDSSLLDTEIDSFANTLYTSALRYLVYPRELIP